MILILTEVVKCQMKKKRKKEIFNRLVGKRAHKSADIKYKIDLNKLVYKFKTDANEPKDFGNYQMPWKLFEEL